MNTSIESINQIKKYHFMYDSEYSPIYDTPYDTSFTFGCEDEEEDEECYGYESGYISPNSNSFYQ